MTDAERQCLELHWMYNFFTFFCNTFIPYPTCEFDDKFRATYNEFLDHEAFTTSFSKFASRKKARKMVESFFDPIVKLIFFMKSSNLLKPYEYDAVSATEMLKDLKKAKTLVLDEREKNGSILR